MSTDRVPRTPTYLILPVWVVGICAAALYEGPVLAVHAAAYSLLVFAALRLFLPEGIVPSVRGRALDVVFPVVGAILLFLLAPIADTPMSL